MVVVDARWRFVARFYKFLFCLAVRVALICRGGEAIDFLYRGFLYGWAMELSEGIFPPVNRRFI